VHYQRKVKRPASLTSLLEVDISPLHIPWQTVLRTPPPRYCTRNPPAPEPPSTTQSYATFAMTETRSCSVDRLLPVSEQARSNGGDSLQDTRQSSMNSDTAAGDDTPTSQGRTSTEQARAPDPRLQPPASASHHIWPDPPSGGRGRRYPEQLAFTNTYAPPSHELRDLNPPQTLPASSTDASTMQYAVPPESSEPPTRGHEHHSPSDICSGLCGAMGPTVYAVGMCSALLVVGAATKTAGVW
jgi:hypothetical protein